MRLTFSPEQVSLLSLVRSILPPDQDIFLVGGAVRDALLGMENHDLDFALPVNPTYLAKRIAKILNSAFFVLDDKRHTARILYKTDKGHEFPLDFVQFTGNSLLEDLQNRDFTINAMAVSLGDLGTLIDPLRGRADLEGRILRASGRHSVMDDPIRVLRGIRISHQFDLHYAESLPDMMREAAKFLPYSSFERQRDELFKILEGSEPDEALRDCQRFDVIASTFPDLAEQNDVPASPPHIHPLFEHTLQSLKYFSQIIELLEIDRNEWNPDTGWCSTFVTKIAPFSSKLKNYFDEEITPGRRKYGLAMFGALLHDIGKPKTIKMGEDGRYHFYGHDKIGAELAWEAAKKIQLSKAESEWVQKFVHHHMGLLQWGHSDVPPTRRGIYRFFKKTTDVGVAIALFSLADRLATYGELVPAEKWEKNLEIVEILLTNWWEHTDQVISPKPLLDGHDLQKDFGLHPGRKIGQLLEALVEAQASGEVTDRGEAQKFIRAQLE